METHSHRGADESGGVVGDNRADPTCELKASPAFAGMLLRRSEIVLAFCLGSYCRQYSFHLPASKYERLDAV